MAKANVLKKDIEDYIKHAIDYKDNIRINHINCPAGQDLKQRLYITKTQDGYLGHCFNCGNSGWSFTRKDVFSPHLDHFTEVVMSPENTKKTVEDILGKVSSHYGECQLLAKTWLLLHGIEEVDYYALGIYSLRDVIVLPVKDSSGYVVGLVCRDFENNNKNYRNYFRDDKVPWIERGTSNPDTLVITEDIISAYRVWRATGYSTMALLGTNFTENYLKPMKEHGIGYPSKVIVWLDKDTAGTRATSTVAFNIHSILRPEVTRFVADQEEPKKLSDDEIRKVVDNV